MDLYKLAFTHSSFSKDHPEEPDNERLEFYGDAVLKLVFSKYLFNRFEDSQEGDLTKYRARLISDDLLSSIGAALEFEKKIIVGQSLRNKKIPKSVVGDTVEAYIGALYIDQSYEAAEKFILESWEPFIDQALKEALEDNHKAILQDLTQRQFKEKPEYKTIDTQGPDHQRTFKVAAYFNDHELGVGFGSSKKEASQSAAKEAVKNWKKISKSFQ